MNRLFFIVPTVDFIDHEFDTYLAPSLLPRWKKNTYCMDNSEGESIYEKYNNGIQKLIRKRKLTDDDIIVFAHSDITILDQSLEDKLRLTFEYKTEVGIIGVYGATQFNEQFGWWLNDREKYARGHIQQGLDGSTYHMSDRIGFFDNMVVVDGCFMAIRGSLAKSLQFRTNMDGYHHYENSYCIDTLLRTEFKVAVVDIFIQHESEGPLSEDWFNSGQKLLKEYTGMGLEFPLTSENLNRHRTLRNLNSYFPEPKTDTKSPGVSA
jgi:hypothetical protein